MVKTLKEMSEVDFRLEKKSKQQYIFYYEDVEDRIRDFNEFVRILRDYKVFYFISHDDFCVMEHIMEKYNIEPVDIEMNPYEQILYVSKKIFGEW